MEDAKGTAKGLFDKFTESSGAIPVALTLSPNAPHYWDRDRPDKEGLIGALKTLWRVDENVAAIRRALFAGSLDELMHLSGGLKTETLVRYFDQISGLYRLEPMSAFLGVSSTPLETASADCNLNDWQPDLLTKEFLSDCYRHEGNFQLPASAMPAHILNTVGVVRALAWLQTSPKIVVSDDTGVDHHEFPAQNGPPIKLAEDEAELGDLVAKRAAHTTGKGGTGVNEYSPFVWCDFSVDQVADCSFSAAEFINTIARKYLPEDGSIHLEMFALDHVGINCLIGKAKARGIIGPLRLSANALIADPNAGSVVIQQKRDQKKFNPRHTFGGSFMVADPKQKDSYLPSDGSDIVRCARREVLEESNIALPLSSQRPFKDIPALLLLQTDPPFIQICFLGWPVSTAEIDNCFESKENESSASNDEGTALRIPLVPTSDKKLQSVAESFYEGEGNRKPWRPTGLLALYAWYKIGCPGIPEEAKARLKQHLGEQNWPPKLATKL